LKKYECLYIIHPDADGEAVSRAVKKVEDTLKASGGEPVNVQHWGKRKLAYFINKQRFGSYVLMHFQGEAPDISGFQTELEIDDNVLAYLTIRLDEFPDFATLSIPQSFDAERPRRSGPPGARRPRYRDDEDDFDGDDDEADERPSRTPARPAVVVDEVDASDDEVIEEATVEEDTSPEEQQKEGE
jgi:small subunit ribosomal protein S6